MTCEAQQLGKGRRDHQAKEKHCCAVQGAGSIPCLVCWDPLPERMTGFASIFWFFSFLSYLQNLAPGNGRLNTAYCII